MLGTSLHPQIESHANQPPEPLLKEGSFYAQLAQHGKAMFDDAAFASFYSPRMGRPSVPPHLLCLLLLLQWYCGCSDSETVERSAYDLRWQAVLGLPPGMPLCARTPLEAFRDLLISNKQAGYLFLASLKEAKRAKLLKGPALLLALDTKPVLGRGAVCDPFNLIAEALKKTAYALARQEKVDPIEWMRSQGLERYLTPSVKGSADLDWSDDAQKNAFLTLLVTDARRLLQMAQAAQTAASAVPTAASAVPTAASAVPTAASAVPTAASAVPTASSAVPTAASAVPTAASAVPTASSEAPTASSAARKPLPEAELLARLLAQDVEETPDANGVAQATIQEGTAKGRIPSVTDPEQRHGRKSASKRFTGGKADVACDGPSQILVAVGDLAGDDPDAQNALTLVQQAQANTAMPVAQTTGDCAYGSGSTRQEFVDAGQVLHAKVPSETTGTGLFPKSRFEIDLEHQTVTCPAGQTTGDFREDKAGGRVFSFGAVCQDCPLRALCSTSATGRSVRVHPQEALLQQARVFQNSPEGRATLRARVVVEHCLARLGNLGIGQARYRGRAKTRFQLLMCAAVANLRWTWNWEASQAASEGPLRGSCGAFWRFLGRYRDGIRPTLVLS